MERLIRILAVIACVALLPEAAFAAQTVLTVASSWGDAQTEVEKARAIEFEKENPDIKIEWVDIAGNETEMREKLFVMAASGVFPDVLPVSYQARLEFLQRGLLEDLQPYFDRETDKSVSLEGVHPDLIEAAKFNGGLWGIPMDVSLWVTNYLADPFGKAGLATPIEMARAGNWDFDAMETAAKKTTLWRQDGTLDRIGLLANLGTAQLSGYVWGFGGNIWSADGTTAELDSPGGLEGISFLHDLLFNQKTAAPRRVAGNDILKSGQFAMAPWWSTVVAPFKNWGFENFDQAPFPAGPKGEDTNLLQVHIYSMSAVSDKKEAAWRYLRYVGSDEGERWFVRDLGRQPTRISLFNDYIEASKKSGIQGAEFYPTALDHSQPRGVPVDPQAEAKMDDLLSGIWDGTADPVTATKEAVRNVNAYLKDVASN